MNDKGMLETFVIVTIILVLCALVIEYVNCDGTLVRGLFWMECIK